MGTAGISVHSRTGVTVENCHPTDFFTRIQVADSATTIVRNNSANGNNQGFEVQRSAATLTNNTANDNDSWGFFLGGANVGPTLSENVADNNQFIGYALSDTSGNVLDLNHAIGNDTNFNLGGSDDNTLSNNVAEGPGAGFALDGLSNNNMFNDNTALGTSGASSWGSSVGFIAQDGALSGSGNTFADNTARDTFKGFVDTTNGAGTAGTDNTYATNSCIGNDIPSEPPGLCS